MAQYTIDKPYKYPAIRDANGSIKYKTWKEKREAYQIPDEIVGKLTTEALVETCIDYPLAFTYTAFNDERVGISSMIENFNDLKELSKREDGTLKLIEAYKNTNYTKTGAAKSLNFRESLLIFDYLELLLVDGLFISKLDTNGLNKLKKISLEKYLLKLDNIESFGLEGIRKSLLVSSVVVLKNNVLIGAEEKNDLQKFIDSFSTIPAENLESVSKLVTIK